MIARLICSLATSCALFAVAPLHAQPAGGAGAEDRPAAPPPPAGRSDDLLNGIAVDFSISDDDPEASVEVGNSFMVGQGRNENGIPEFLNANWDIKLTVPLAGDDDITSSSTLLGVVNGPKLTVNVGLFGFRAADFQNSAFADIMAEACRSEPTEAARADCLVQSNPIAYARQHSGRSASEINRTIFGWMWRAGFEGSLSANRYDYVEAATLVKREDTHFSYSGALVLGFYPPDAMSAIIGRMEYARSYKSEDERIICRPVVVDPSSDCVNGIPAPAGRTEHLNFSLEYRRVFDSNMRAGALAISPRASVDALSGEYSVELPVYFIPANTDFPISPGVRLAYSSEENEFTFGLFLRTTFKL